jgi:hypothetical protein
MNPTTVTFETTLPSGGKAQVTLVGATNADIPSVQQAVNSVLMAMQPRLPGIYQP